MSGAATKKKSQMCIALITFGKEPDIIERGMRKILEIIYK